MSKRFSLEGRNRESHRKTCKVTEERGLVKEREGIRELPKVGGIRRGEALSRGDRGGTGKKEIRNRNLIKKDSTASGRQQRNEKVGRASIPLTQGCPIKRKQGECKIASCGNL